MLRVPYDRLVAEMQKVLVKKGYTEERAELVAKIFADNSLAGVPTHGFNRFARAVFYLNKGMIDPKAEPEVLISSGAFERWDGHRGFGPLNCRMAMDRACGTAEQRKAYRCGLRDVAVLLRRAGERPDEGGEDALCGGIRHEGRADDRPGGDRKDLAYPADRILERKQPLDPVRPHRDLGGA